jgi:ribosomal protein L3 glutamine methyltransferase
VGGVQVREARILTQTTVEQLIHELADQLDAANLSYGHGMDNPGDEAAELVFFAAGLSHDRAPDCYTNTLDEATIARAKALAERRIHERVPTAYLTQRMWFAGHEFYVDERVLVPRSPIAELVYAQFQPWIEPHKVKRVLDIGTGSGCIAIACALVFPDARVDAADISSDALTVTRVNIERHHVQDRVRAVQSDVFSGLTHERYDLIVSNPPYVSHAEMDELPKEYLREPELGLRAGSDGLDVVRRILAEAEAHLEPHGIVVVEVGDSEMTLAEAHPDVPFVWLDFEFGGGGVFVLTAEQLQAHRIALAAGVRG